MTTDDYLSTPETTKRRELLHGVVREPPAPFYSHQLLVTRLTVLLDAHVRAGRLGSVCVSPVDVVLDAGRHLVVQPNVIFVSNARASIIDRQVWGAPDLVVEVLSPGTARHDSQVKLRWYRKYGVSECWLVHPAAETVEVVHLAGPRPRRRTHRSERVRSCVLPDLVLPVRDIFTE